MAYNLGDFVITKGVELKSMENVLGVVGYIISIDIGPRPYGVMFLDDKNGYKKGSQVWWFNDEELEVFSMPVVKFRNEKKPAFITRVDPITSKVSMLAAYGKLNGSIHSVVSWDHFVVNDGVIVQEPVKHDMEFLLLTGSNGHSGMQGNRYVLGFNAFSREEGVMMLNHWFSDSASFDIKGYMDVEVAMRIRLKNLASSEEPNLDMLSGSELIFIESTSLITTFNAKYIDRRVIISKDLKILIDDFVEKVDGNTLYFKSHPNPINITENGLSVKYLLSIGNPVEIHDIDYYKAQFDALKQSAVSADTKGEINELVGTV